MVCLGAKNTTNITQPPQDGIPGNEEKEGGWIGKSSKLGDQNIWRPVSDYIVHKLCDFRLILCRIYLGSGLPEAEPETGIQMYMGYWVGVGALSWKGMKDAEQRKELSKDVFSSGIWPRLDPMWNLGAWITPQIFPSQRQGGWAVIPQISNSLTK